MEPSELIAIALDEQARARSIIAGLGPCPIRLSNATTVLGSYSVDVRAGTAVIRLSRHISDAAHARDTVRHELAHQAAHELHGHVGHGPLWQTWARYLGCAPVSCARGGIDPAAAAARGRYVLTCRDCGLTITRQRRSKLVRNARRYACARCSGAFSVTRVPAP